MLRFTAAALFGCGFAVLGAARASADVMLLNRLDVGNYSMTLNGSAMTDEQRPALNAFFAAPFGESTIYGSKTDVCVSNRLYSLIVHQGGDTATIYFPWLKQYMVASSEALAEAGDSLWNNPAGAKTAPLECSVVDLHQTETILGHITHRYHYRILSKDASPQISGDLWLCRDFSELDGLNAHPFSSNRWINCVLSHVKGAPLKSTCAVQMGPATVNITMAATGIMTDTLPPITFTPPAGFTRIDVGKTDGAEKLKGAITQSFGLMLAAEASSKITLRSYDVYQGDQKAGTAQVSAYPTVFDGRPVSRNTLTLITHQGNASAGASDLTTCASDVDADGALVHEDFSVVAGSGATSKMDVRYFRDHIAVTADAGDAHTQKTIPIPSGLPIYSMGDSVAGFARWKQPNLGWVGIGGVFDKDSMRLKICQISLLASNAALHDAILGARTDLVKYSITTDNHENVLYDDGAGDVLRADLPGGLLLRRASDFQTQLTPSSEPPAWFQLPDASNAVQSDVSIPDPRSCRSLTVEIREPGKPEKTLHILAPEPIERGGDLAEVGASHEFDASLASDKTLALDSSAIQRQAKEIKGDSRGLYEIATRTCDWVNHALTYSSSTLLIDNRTAPQILASKEGVCRDYAVLYTALARAEGAPTRLCSGIVSVDGKGKFAYHEWAETYMGKQYGWVAVDPTFGQHIADATHMIIEYGDDDVPLGTKAHILSAGQ